MRWAFGIEYNGTNYHGWQSQHDPQLNTVQGCVERAITKIANHQIQVVCAGRTDRGVHAVGQVIHFDTDAERKPKAWLAGTNCYLPDDTRVLWAQLVDEEFHARYTAIARHYRYIIYNSPIRPAILREQVTWFPTFLQTDKMQLAGNFLLGEHDFSAFRGADCQAKTTIRRLESLTVVRQKDFVIIDIRANAFLHHMVRNIVGVLQEIGIGKREPNWAQEVLLGRKRSLGGVTADASGLYLTQVIYPSPWDFPVSQVITFF